MFSFVTFTHDAKAATNRPAFPLFVDVWDYANGSYNETPNGVNLGTLPNGEGNLTVSGLAGSSTLTVNSVNVGSISDYALASSSQGWAIVILGDDNIYRVYTVYGVSGMTFSIYPALVSSVTSKSAGNLHDAALGQHLTTIGYYGLADFMTRYTKRYAYMQYFASRYVSDGTGAFSGSPWAGIGGLTNGGYVGTTTCMYKGILTDISNIAGAPISPCIGYNGADRSYITGSVYNTLIAANAAGQGGKQTANLQGKSGFLDTYLSIKGQQDATTTPAARVKVIIDGVTVLNKNFGGLTHIQVPYDHANSGEIDVTVDNNNPTAIRVSNTSWYVWNDAIWNGASPNEPLIPNGAKVVLLEDSWGTMHNSAFYNRLKTNLASSTITNVSVGGMQATWGIANYPTLVAPLNPDYVISDFQINDFNAGVSQTQWLANLQTLWNLALSNNATPIYLRSLPTASLGQMQELNKMDQTLVSNFVLPLETTPPIITITAPTSTAITNGNSVVSFTETDPDNTTPVNPQCSIDNSNWTNCVSGTTKISDIVGWSGVANGTSTLYVKDIDAAGNVGTSSVSFTKKINPPTILSFIMDRNSTNFANRTTISATDNTGVVGYLLNELSSTPSLSDPNWTSSVPTTYTASSMGNHTVYLWVRDVAGNLASSTQNVNIIPVQGGTIIILSTPSAGSGQTSLPNNDSTSNSRVTTATGQISSAYNQATTTALTTGSISSRQTTSTSSWNNAGQIILPVNPTIQQLQQKIAELKQQLQAINIKNNTILTKQIQQILQDKGFFPKSIKPNGVFGPTTRQSIIKFQKKHRLTPTGTIGPKTRKALGM